MWCLKPFLTVTIVWFLISTGYSQQTDRDRFLITLANITDEYASVHARVMVKDGKLFTGSGGSYDWQRGWADFIGEFKAEDLNGNSLTVVQKGESFESYWSLEQGGKAFDGTAQVTYKVDLRYAHQDWDFGNEQAGDIYQDGLYTVTKPLFVSTGLDRGADVKFDIPQDWQIASPWQAVEGAKNTFIALDWEALDNNAVSLGAFDHVINVVNGFELEIILLGDFASASPLVTETVEKILPVYLGLFPDTPREKYLMFYLNGPSEDAEAFRNGAAFTTSLSLSSDNRIFWADFLAHELFHFWNGVRIRAEERWQGNWFSEGFTDYYANLVLVNRGVLSEEWFIRRMENIFGNYLWFHFSDVFEGLSVLEAGKEKGRNRFGVYDAGWVLAFALDHDIRTKTEGRKTLDDAMTAVFDQFGRNGERYDPDTLIGVISDATGLDLDPFFNRYLKTRTPLPLKEIMTSYGFESYSNRYANEYYLTRDKDASREASLAWEKLINHRFPDRL